MRWVASLIALGLMMALFHHLTAAGPLEGRAAFALGLLLVAAWLAGVPARRARLPRITGFLLVGLSLGPAWLHVVRADEVRALGFVVDAGVALIAFAAGSALPLATLRAERNKSRAVSAVKDVTLIALFAAVLVVARLVGSPGTVRLGAAARSLGGLAASLALGLAVGAAVAEFLTRTRADATLGLVALAFVAALVARTLHGDAMLVALAAGFYLGSFAPPQA